MYWYVSNYASLESINLDIQNNLSEASPFAIFIYPSQDTAWYSIFFRPILILSHSMPEIISYFQHVIVDENTIQS
jgi:hypothetical protein